MINDGESVVSNSLSWHEEKKGNLESDQHTPCGINRHILLIIYYFYVAVSAAVYINWSPLALMLYENDAFEYLCEKDSNNKYIEDLRVTEDKPYICNEQESAVANLFTITLSSNCIGSAFGGVVLDYLGMKITGCIGQGLNIIAWILMAISSPTLNTYYPAHIILGLSCDISFLPSLLITRLFPGNTYLVITIIGSGASLSFIVTYCMQSIQYHAGYSLKILSVGYILFFLVPAFLVALILMPYVSFKTEEELQYLLQQDIDKNIHLDNINDTVPNDVSTLKTQNEKTGNERRDSNIEEIDITNEENILDVETIIQNEDENKNGDNSTNKTNMDTNNIDTTSFETTRIEKSLKDEMLNFNYFAICIYFCVAALTICLYQQSATIRLFSDDVVREALSILLILSAIPCIIFGKFADIYGPVALLFTVNTCGVLSLFFVLFQNIPMGIFSTIFYSLYMSMYTSQMFCFIEYTTAPKHLGKLIGTCSMIGGIFNLIGLPIYKYIIVGYHKGDPLVVMGCMLGVLLALYILLTLLLCRMKKNRKNLHIGQKERCRGICRV